MSVVPVLQGETRRVRRLQVARVTYNMDYGRFVKGVSVREIQRRS